MNLVMQTLKKVTYRRSLCTIYSQYILLQRNVRNICSISYLLHMQQFYAQHVHVSTASLSILHMRSSYFGGNIDTLKMKQVIHDAHALY